jgi:hypothetical protein
MACNARWACAESLNSIDDAKIATMNSIALSARKAAIVLAVKGEALALWPDGCPSDRCPRASS